MKKKIGIVIDNEFSIQHNPPYPHPSFFSYENPNRIKAILNYFNRIHIFERENIRKLEPVVIEEEVLKLAHSQFYIDQIKRLSKFGNGILSEEVYVAKDSYSLAKKAVGGVIKAIESVLYEEVSHSFAIVRPPGHHALREQGSGLCIFNNIATSILYLREKKNYYEKIAIIDIDDHFGDGIARYFYEDPDILYFSVHEFDFIEGDIGFITELGAGKGIGKTINFPIPMNTNDKFFLKFFDILAPILKEFNPDLIIVATGFDMHFADQIGNCLLTTRSYYEFSKRISEIADEICRGKLVFALEGGYSLIALPFCVMNIIKPLINEEYQQEIFETIKFNKYNNESEILKVKNTLKKLLQKYWNCFK